MPTARTGARQSPEATTGGDTRDRILRAAISCYARYGNDRTTLQDVAVMAGVARNTVYRYFADRNELGAAVRDFEHHNMAAEFARRAEHTTDLTASIAVLVEILHDTIERYQVRRHLADLDLGQLRAWLLRRGTDAQFVRDILGSRVQAAYAAGAFAEGLTPAAALDWIVVALSTHAFVDVPSLDAADGAAVGRFYSVNIVRGLGRP